MTPTSNISQFFAKLALFISIILLVDFSLGKSFQFFFFKQTSGLFYRTTYAMDKTEAEIVIFGTSRANHHYHSLVFRDSLKMSCYNAGKDGNGVFYNYAVLKCMIKRNKPKLIIYDLTVDEFFYSKDSYDRLADLLPYYNSHPELKPIICLKSRYENIKLHSGIYPYNSKLLTIIIGNMDINKSRKSDIEGFVPLPARDSLLLLKLREINTINEKKLYKLDSIKVEYFQKFLKLALENKILVKVIVSPIFRPSISNDSSIKIAESISKTLGIDFANLSNLYPISSMLGYFYDPIHLNEKGAINFSQYMIKYIKQTD